MSEPRKSTDAKMILCANCGTRPGTIRWGDVLAVTHGMAEMWCEPCALAKQIEHAEERAAALPELLARHAVLTHGPRIKIDWTTRKHRFLTKPWEREGDPGYDGDPESCGLCDRTEGNPIHA